MIEPIIYIQSVGSIHRKEHGQFFTHPMIAKFMVDWVLMSGKTKIYDPAFGLGAFKEPIQNNTNIDFTASELDAKILNYWTNFSGQDASFIKEEDYLLSWGQRHENIVCNPPYKRFQKFINRDVVFEEFITHTGIKLSGYTNTASAFLIKSLSELDNSGRLAYIMPSEFLNTGYGVIVKNKLIENGHLLSIISLNCEKDVFPDATTSISIILYDASTYFSSVRFYSVNSINSLTDILNTAPTTAIKTEELNPNAKWLPFFNKTEVAVDIGKTTTLEHYGRFSRGIATGANEFFILKPSEARKKGLVSSELQPCISKSSQINKIIFDDEDYQRLHDDDSPVLLFSADVNPTTTAGMYIKDGEAMGFNKRYLTKKRNPWYKAEVRRPAPLLLGVFSRCGYKIILNTSSILNLTCFHGFHPNLFGSKYIDHLFLYFLSNTGRSILSLSIRKYGASLDKFEPNDLNTALVPSPDFFDSIPQEAITTAIQHIKDKSQIPDFIEAFFDELNHKQEIASMHN